MKSFFKNIIVSILTWEAKAVLARRKPFIIAVTGSVGKTGTKDAIYAVLNGSVGGGEAVRKSEKSFNSEIGVPLTILGLPNAWSNPFLWLINIARGAFLMVCPCPYPKTLVLEIGADHPGDIAKTVAWMKPDIAVVTSLPDCPVHVEFFSGPEEVIKEKSELVKALRPGGYFVANVDDPAVLALRTLTQASVITYGHTDDAVVRGSAPDVRYTEGESGKVPVGMTFTVLYEGERYEANLHGVLGAQSSFAILASLAVGLIRGLTFPDMLLRISSLVPTPGRMRIILGRGATTIIDDSYNSSPVAVVAGLDALRAVEGKHKIAVLGDMLELGERSRDEHWKVGRLAGSFVDTLVVVGERARVIAEAAKTSGLPQEKIHLFSDSVSAGEWLKSEIKPGDVILVKGSQGSGKNMIRMERAVKLLMAHPEHAPALLVRQEKEWQAQYYA